MKAGRACKNCNSMNIIDEVVDFCGDCRSYDIDFRDENGIFYTDTEEYQKDLKEQKIQDEINERIKKIKNLKEIDTYPEKIKILQQMKKILDSASFVLGINSRNLKSINKQDYLNFREFSAVNNVSKLIKKLEKAIKTKDLENDFIPDNLLKEEVKILNSKINQINQFIKENIENNVIKSDITEYKKSLKEYEEFHKKNNRNDISLTIF